MYLFQDRKLQPSTIDGYRSAIADKLGNSPINGSKDENLTRLQCTGKAISTDPAISLLGLDNVKDSMTSRCLDKKEVRGAI